MFFTPILLIFIDSPMLDHKKKSYDERHPSHQTTQTFSPVENVDW